jgi:hypothetical protein
MHTSNKITSFPVPMQFYKTGNGISETLYICGFRGGIPERLPDHFKNEKLV